MNNVLREVTEHPQFSNKPLGVKLAPYFDLSYVKQAVSIITKYPIKYIVTTNTIGNALFVDSESECAAIAPVFGGLGGKSPFSNDNVYVFIHFEISNADI